MYSENYKTLLREFNEDLNKWKDIPYSQLGRLNVVKMAVPPKLIWGLNAIPIKIPADLFWVEIDKMILKFIWNWKGAKIVKIIF